MRRIVILAVAVAIALMIPSMALGASSTCQAYSPQECSASNQGTSDGADGSLPFTGLNTALLAVVGSTLLGAGLVVRQLSRSRENN